MRSRLALTVGLALLVVVAGCGGSGGGEDDGPVVAEASAVDVDPAALSATGYERVDRSNRTTNTTLTVSIQGDVTIESTFDVRATTQRVVYERAVAGGTAAVGVLGVPGVRPAEAIREPRNPFADRGPAALATNATTYAVRDAREAGSTTVRLLGNETTLRRYEATGERGGESLPVTVAVATVRHDGDFVSLVAVVPRDGDERERVARLAEGVRH